MFQLSVQDIHPGEKAGDKEEAIRQVAAALVQAGNVAEGYVNGMLAREQQTSTFLGNGIAIPHGTTDTRDQVLKTGVQVFQFPEGVTWGDGQVAYVAIGIAASSDEHLGLLRQLTHVLSDDSVAEQLKSATTAEELRALLMGEKQSEQLKLDNEMLTLDIVASDLLTLQALNAARLKEAGAVDATFVTKAINEQPLNLGQGIWLSDSAEGNLRSAIAVSRAANAFDVDGETAAMLVSVAMNDDQPIAVLKRLADLLLDNKADRLLKADAATLLALLTSDDAPTDDVLSAEFVVRNEHGLHARPGTMLVNTIKQFNSDITVTNLDGTGKPANGRSLMKVVALGVKKGHEVTFTIEGADEEAAYEEKKPAEPRKAMGFIAVSIGAGMNEIFKELGADYIIEGGQTMNPSTEDMLNAIDRVNADTVFILPNNKNIVLAANQAKSLVEEKEIIVIPTKTVPQGITAIINFMPDADAKTNEEAMLEEIKNVKTGQVTYAVRDTHIDDKEIHEGDIMGIGDSGILAVGKDLEETTKELIANLVDEDSELISIYYGEEVSEEEAEKFAGEIEELYPDVDVDIQFGGQPIYYYVLAVE